MGKSTISMAIFKSYVKLPEGTPNNPVLHCPGDVLGPLLEALGCWDRLDIYIYI